MGDDGKMVMSASNDGSFKCWDKQSGKEILSMNGCNGASVECFEVFGNGNMVMLGGENGVCHLYDIRKMDAKAIGNVQRDGHCIKKMKKMDGKENELIVSNANGNVWKWNIDKLKKIDVMTEWTGNE